MPCFIIPGSQGGKKPYPFSARRVREFNDCNLPRGESDGGRWGRNDDPRCKGGGADAARANPHAEKDPTKADDPNYPFDWQTKGRQRAIFGADLTPDTEADKITDLSNTSAIRADMGGEGSEQKRIVATALGKRWAERMEADDSFGGPAEAQGAFDAFYDQYQNSIENHAQSVGMMEGDGSENENYDYNAENAPDPDEAQSEYEQYEESARNAIDEQVRADQEERFSKNRDDGFEVMDGAVAETLAQHAAAVAERRATTMDTSGHPMLPLPPGEEFQKPVREALTGAKVGEILTKHGLFTGDEFDEAMDDDSRPSNKISYLDTIKTVFDPSLEEDPAMRAKYEAAREELMQYDAEAYSAHMHERMTKSDMTPFTTDERAIHEHELTMGRTHMQKGLQSKYFNNTTVDYEAFEQWWDKNSGDVYDNADYSEIDSFDSWYNDKYGLSTEDWHAYQDKKANPPSPSQADATTRYERAASWLVSKWADTSGDGDPMSVTMQMAAEQEFGLGETYNRVFSSRGGLDTMGTVQRNLSAHGPVLRHFLRGMYDNTQEWLGQFEGDYVTVYRGFSSKENGEEPGMSSVDYREGSIVGVKMQPMSSFSVKFNTAFDAFGEDIIVTRIPKTQIIGSSMSGYGCLGEYEVVVLGGSAGSTVRGFFAKKAWLQHRSTEYARILYGPPDAYGGSSYQHPVIPGAKDSRESTVAQLAQKRLDEFLRIHGGAGSRVAQPERGEAL